MATFRGKEIKVIYSEGAEQQYRVITDETLSRSIQRSELLLKQDPFYGIQIKKSLIPQKYKAEYSTTNLWKVDLSDFWRLLYTITSTEYEIIIFVLEIIDHKTYDNIFGYRGQ